MGLSHAHPALCPASVVSLGLIKLHQDVLPAAAVLSSTFPLHGLLAFWKLNSLLV